MPASANEQGEDGSQSCRPTTDAGSPASDSTAIELHSCEATTSGVRSEWVDGDRITISEMLRDHRA